MLGLFLIVPKYSWYHPHFPAQGALAVLSPTMIGKPCCVALAMKFTFAVELGAELIWNMFTPAQSTHSSPG